MTDAHKTMSLARPPRAFRIDASWYRSYWYDCSQRHSRKRGFDAVQAVLFIAVMAGTYFACISQLVR
jgi:hypothetical protein